MIDTSPKCLNCEKPLKGRPDKKYCNDGCRNEYFNKQKEIERKEIRKVDLALKKNRRILKELFNRNESESVHENELEEMGFMFRYHTHHHITTSTREQREYLFCYDYAYCKIREGRYKIIKAFK